MSRTSTSMVYHIAREVGIEDVIPHALKRLPKSGVCYPFVSGLSENLGQAAGSPRNALFLREPIAKARQALFARHGRLLLDFSGLCRETRYLGGLGTLSPLALRMTGILTFAGLFIATNVFFSGLAVMVNGVLGKNDPHSQMVSDVKSELVSAGMTTLTLIAFHYLISFLPLGPARIGPGMVNIIATYLIAYSYHENLFPPESFRA